MKKIIKVEVGTLDYDYNDAEYAKKPKLKQLDWSMVPIGTMTNKGELRGNYKDDGEIRFDVEQQRADVLGIYQAHFPASDLRLAPHSEQKWIAVQDDDDQLYGGLIYHKEYAAHDNGQLLRYKVTGLAEGYTDGGVV